MRIISSTLAIIAGWMVLSAPTLSRADPQSDVCQLLDELMVSADQGIAHISKLASWWPEQQKRQSLPTVEGLLKPHQYTGGNIYLVGDLGEDAQDFIMVIYVKGTTLLYLRLLFERGGNDLGLTNLDFDGEYGSAINKRPVLQKPEKVVCR